MATARRRRSPTLADIQGPGDRARGTRLGRLPVRIPSFHPMRYVPDREPIDLSAVPEIARNAMRLYFNLEDQSYLDELDELQNVRRERIRGKSDIEPSALQLATDVAGRRATFKRELRSQDLPISRSGRGVEQGPATYLPQAQEPEKLRLLNEAIGALVKREQIPAYAHPGTNTAIASSLGKQVASEAERLLYGLTEQVAQYDFGGDAGRGRPRFSVDDAIRAVDQSLRERHPIIDPDSPQYSPAAEGVYLEILDKVQDHWKTTQVGPALNNSYRVGFQDKVLKPEITGYLNSIHDPAKTTTAPSLLLDPVQERAFQAWYAKWAEKTGISSNPDDPAHQYSYRAAFLAQESPRKRHGKWSWPDEFRRLNQGQGGPEASPSENPDGKTAAQVATTQAIIRARDNYRATFPGDIDAALHEVFATHLKEVAASRELSSLEKRSRLEDAMDVIEDVAVGGANVKLGDTEKGAKLHMLFSDLMTRIEGRGAGGRGMGFYDDSATSLMAPIVKKFQELFGDQDIRNDAQGLADMARAKDAAVQEYLKAHPELSAEDQNGVRAAVQRLFARQGEFAGMRDTSAAAAASLQYLAGTGRPEEARELAGQLARMGLLAVPDWQGTLAQIEKDEAMAPYQTPDTSFSLSMSASRRLHETFAKIPLDGTRSLEIQEQYDRNLAAFRSQYRSAVQRALEEGKDGKAAGDEWMQKVGLDLLAAAERPMRETFGKQDEMRSQFAQANTARKAFSPLEIETVRQWLPSDEAELFIRRNRVLTSISQIRKDHNETLRRLESQTNTTLLTSLDFVRLAQDQDQQGDRMGRVVSAKLSQLFNQRIDQVIDEKRKAGFTDAELTEAFNEVAEWAQNQVTELFAKTRAGDKTLRDIVMREADLDGWRRAILSGSEGEEKGHYALHLNALHPALTAAIASTGVADDLVNWMRDRRRYGQFGPGRKNLWLKNDMPEAMRDLDQAIDKLQLPKEARAEISFLRTATFHQVHYTDVLTKGKTPGLYQEGITNYHPMDVPFFRNRKDLVAFVEDRAYAYEFLKKVGFTQLNENVPLRQNTHVRSWLDVQLDLLELHGKK